jgi:hypothetical protein
MAAGASNKYLQYHTPYRLAAKLGLSCFSIQCVDQRFSEHPTARLLTQNAACRGDCTLVSGSGNLSERSLQLTLGFERSGGNGIALA